MTAKLKLLWAQPKVEFKGKSVLQAWAEEMKLQGWDFTDKPDEADCMFFGSDSQLHDELFSKELPAPSILYFWGWLPERLVYDRQFKQHAAKQLEKMARVTRILVPCPTVADQLADFGLPSQLCMPGVDARTLESTFGNGEIVPNQVMFLSRLASHKGLDLLIQALGLIEPQRPNLLVCGPGDPAPYQKMADQLKVSVKFCELDDQEKVVELRRSAMLVHPSQYEGWGLSPLEALFCCTPVISYDLPQSRWVLQEDADYFSSVDGLARTILNVIQNPWQARMKAAKGADRISHALTLTHAAQRLWVHIHQVIKEFLGQELRQHPDKWQEIYDAEHRQNYAYGQKDVLGYNGPARFDPTWVRHWRAEAFIKALKECKAQYILDVGSGPVYPTIFAREGFTVVALDISQECLSQVREIATKWGVQENVTTRQGDAQKLDLPDNIFGAVIHGEIWEHLPEPDKAVREALRVLKPGGYLIASTPIGGHHHDAMHVREWNNDSITAFVNQFQFTDQVVIKTLGAIAEDGCEPSCYLIVLEKKGSD